MVVGRVREDREFAGKGVDRRLREVDTAHGWLGHAMIQVADGEGSFTAGVATTKGKYWETRYSAVRAEKYVRAVQQASTCCRSSSGMIAAALVHFAYLAVSRVFAALWLLRMTDREKDVEILALRHQLAVLHRQLGDQRPRLRQRTGCCSPPGSYDVAPTPTVGQPGHGAEVASRLDQAPPCPHEREPRVRTAAYCRFDPPSCPAPRNRESVVGVSTHPR